MLIRIRHKFFAELRKPDHLFSDAIKKTLCGRVAQWNIHNWDKLLKISINDDSNNSMCGSCRNLFDAKNEKPLGEVSKIK